MSLRIKSLITLATLSAGALIMPTTAQAVYVGLLDGTSHSSTFETGGVSPLPANGWIAISGSAQLYDGASNGIIVGTTQYDNYRVQYDTGISIAANTQYTLHFDMGFAAALAGGSADYSFELGTLSAGSFTSLSTPTAGNISWLGNITSGVISGSDDFVFTTGSSVSGDELSVQWAQVGTTGSPFSDFFGFDNVTLSATAVSAVPEPSTYAAIAFGVLGLVLVMKRRLGKPTKTKASD